MLKKYLLLFLILNFFRVVNAQDHPSENKLSVDLGLHFSRSQDLVFSPMIYKGGSPGFIRVAYDRKIKNGNHKLKIHYDQASTESTDLISFPGFGESNMREASTMGFLDFEYGYLREVYSKENFSLEAGGRLNAFAHLAEIVFGFGDDDGFLIAYTLSPQAKANWQLSENRRLEIATAFPITSFVMRPLYSIVDNGQIQNEDGDFGYFHENGSFKGQGGLTRIQLELGYFMALSPKIDFKVGYEFQYLKYKDPIQIALLKNNITAGLNFKF